MKYADEFDSKYGFDDGDSMPPDAWAVRAVSIYAMNRIAEELGIPIRMAPLDRPGLHNCYLWNRIPASVCQDVIDKVGHKLFAYGPWEGHWDQPDDHWKDFPSNDDDDERWYDLVWGPVSEISYEVVNNRNQPRWFYLEGWIKRYCKRIKKAMPTEQAEKKEEQHGQESS